MKNPITRHIVFGNRGRNPEKEQSGSRIKSGMTEPGTESRVRFSSQSFRRKPESRKTVYPVEAYYFEKKKNISHPA